MIELEWDNLGKEKPFNPVTDRGLQTEPFILIFDEVNTALNTRGEYWSSCPHWRKYVLSNSSTAPQFHPPQAKFSISCR